MNPYIVQVTRDREGQVHILQASLFAQPNAEEKTEDAVNGAAPHTDPLSIRQHGCFRM